MIMNSTNNNKNINSWFKNDLIRQKSSIICDSDNSACVCDYDDNDKSNNSLANNNTNEFRRKKDDCHCYLTSKIIDDRIIINGIPSTCDNVAAATASSTFRLKIINNELNHDADAEIIVDDGKFKVKLFRNRTNNNKDVNSSCNNYDGRSKNSNMMDSTNIYNHCCINNIGTMLTRNANCNKNKKKVKEIVDEGGTTNLFNCGLKMNSYKNGSIRNRMRLYFISTIVMIFLLLSRTSSVLGQPPPSPPAGVSVLPNKELTEPVCSLPISNFLNLFNGNVVLVFMV